MGGKQKKTTTSTYTPPKWIEDTSQQAVNIGRGIGRQQFRAYEGERVAGLSENERLGMQLAREKTGAADPYFKDAANYAKRGTQSWADADQSRYINPYIKGALDPAAREIRAEGERGAMTLDTRASSMDAFGGSRAALMRAENRESTLEGISDLYKEGYAMAWDRGAQIFGEDRARDMEAAGRFAQLGGQVQDAAMTDISTLMTTGATDRSVEQAMRDFDWGQFVEERDWGFRQLMGVISALEGTKGSYSTTQTTKEVVKKDNTAEIVGAIATIVASAYSSDERLKENIRFIGTFKGIDFYKWVWNEIAISLGVDRFPTVGVIAQEVDDKYTFEDKNGFLMVDYRSLLGGA